MPHWFVKSSIQRLISVLPASHKWNEWFQTRITRSLELTPSRFEARLEHCRRHLDNFLENRPNLQSGFNVFEIGTGWYPVVPVGLFLCGAGHIWTFDISPLLSSDRVKRMLEMFLRYADRGKLRTFLPLARKDRIEQLHRTLANAGGNTAPTVLLLELQIDARTCEAQKTGLPAGASHLFTSTGVLEYIPRPVLQEILSECLRVGVPDSVHSHYLNLVDQYSYFDHSITAFNFLRYSSRAWEYLNSPITWQNRLRVSDYRQLFADSGYRVLREDNTLGNPEDLRKIRLAPEFRDYREVDLLALYSWFVAEPAGRVKG